MGWMDVGWQRLVNRSWSFFSGPIHEVLLPLALPQGAGEVDQPQRGSGQCSDSSMTGVYTMAWLGFDLLGTHGVQCFRSFDLVGSRLKARSIGGCVVSGWLGGLVSPEADTASWKLQGSWGENERKKKKRKRLIPRMFCTWCKVESKDVSK